MPESYEEINYAIRPAKNIERKMLCDVLRKLSAFGMVESYRYIGFGSTYFSDFSLFHRALGIKKMISIEKDKTHSKRFEFNRPYNSISMQFGHSNEILPTLRWNSKTIVWLDYDGKLDKTVLTDVKFVCSNATAGSVVIVTVNAHPGDFRRESRLIRLKLRVGEEKVPADIEEDDLARWGTAAISRRIITNEISETLDQRNGMLEEHDQILYRQLFYFQYADGAKMLTVGGLLYERNQKPIVEGCGFESLPFVHTDLRPEAKPCQIEVPNLTYREIRHLNSQLPRERRKRLHVPKAPYSDLKKYERVYRYFPTFAEAEL